MAQQAADGVWRLEIPLVGNPLKTLNSYLITGERNLLIDTGFRQQPCREAMERQLQELHVDLDRTDIFLTHLHSDHAGLAPELIRPDCRVYIGSVDGRRLVASGQDAPWRAMYEEYVENGFSTEDMEALWDSNPAKSGAPRPWDGYTFLEEGEVLHYGGYALRCMLTPGHTPGHMCLYDGKRKMLFSGDHVLFHITPNICRWSGVADSLGDYLQSLDRVRELPVELLLPAHREETGDLKGRVEELKAHHARRVEEALAIVKRDPGLTAWQIAGHMAWSIRCRSWADFPLTQKFFAVGEALAHLDYLEVRGLVRRREHSGVITYDAQ